jgi:tetratricopeptide (TPR) repeat protein
MSERKDREPRGSRGRGERDRPAEARRVGRDPGRPRQEGSGAARRVGRDPGRQPKGTESRRTGRGQFDGTGRGRGEPRRTEPRRTEPRRAQPQLPALPSSLPSLAAEVLDDLRSAVGSRGLSEVSRHLAGAAAWLDEDRAADALPFAREVKRRAPRSRFGREVLGLCLYRLGRYAEAVAELRAFRRMSGDRRRDVVLADAERGAGQTPSARRRLAAVIDDPSASEADRVEARIVLAATFSDEGDIDRARSTLLEGPKRPRSLADHHLRLWYALGDLEARAGHPNEAAEWFAKIEIAEPGWGDAGKRARR